MSRVASAEDLERQVRRTVYEAFILEARPPMRAEIAARLGLPESDVTQAFARLAAGRVLVLQPGSGEVLMANPFSAVPTPFLVEADSLRWWGNCIWDGLGIPAMVGADARLLTSCPDCGQAISLEIGDGAVGAAQAVAHFVVPAAGWWDDIVFT